MPLTMATTAFGFGRIHWRKPTVQHACITNKGDFSTNQTEEASTHKSAKTHAGTVFVTRDLDLLIPK